MPGHMRRSVLLLLLLRCLASRVRCRTHVGALTLGHGLPLGHARGMGLYLDATWGIRVLSTLTSPSLIPSYQVRMLGTLRGYDWACTAGVGGVGCWGGVAGGGGLLHGWG